MLVTRSRLSSEIDRVKNNQSELNTRVLSKIDDVYSSLNAQHIALDEKVTHLVELLNAILGIDKNSGLSVQEITQARQRQLEYQRRLENGVGDVLEGLPRPPRALTGDQG